MYLDKNIVFILNDITNVKPLNILTTHILLTTLALHVNKCSIIIPSVVV